MLVEKKIIIKTGSLKLSKKNIFIDLRRSYPEVFWFAKFFRTDSSSPREKRNTVSASKALAEGKKNITSSFFFFKPETKSHVSWVTSEPP